MKNVWYIAPGRVLPLQEIEISSSRSGGPGGQHVNTSSTRITVRWNILASAALSDEEKERLKQVLSSQLTTEGDLIVHHSSSRSQLSNKEKALELLAHTIKKALFIPKKRRPTKVSKGATEARLQKKSRRSDIKKLRRESFKNE